MIVFPMAGLSSRFFKAGYTQPKYMLDAHGKSLFDHAVAGFEAYFASHPFLFIVRDLYQTPAFVEARCKALGIADYRIVVLEAETLGQADTVYQGLTRSGWQGPITIFNIDTFRPGFRFPQQAAADGYLEVFQGEGDNWSFAKPLCEGSDRVVETAEKRPISDLCSTGLYHFARCGDFIEAFEAMRSLDQSLWDKGELYVAPLYNQLIAKGLDIRYHLIDRDEVIFCGVPQEYDDFLARG